MTLTHVSDGRRSIGHLPYMPMHVFFVLFFHFCTDPYHIKLYTARHLFEHASHSIVVRGYAQSLRGCGF